jgi:hypothetical protein
MSMTTQTALSDKNKEDPDPDPGLPAHERNQVPVLSSISSPPLAGTEHGDSNPTSSNVDNLTEPGTVRDS